LSARKKNENKKFSNKNKGCRHFKQHVTAQNVSA